jgi:hypothetical protein
MAKRLQRKLSEETRKKISSALSGRKMSDTQKENISKSMKKYWESIPYENNESNMEEDGQEVN